MNDLKPALHDVALKSKTAFLLGIGGGGDIIQTIPMYNYLTSLGVEKIYLAGVSCEWWSEEGTAVSAKPFTCILRPTVYDVKEIQGAKLLSPHVALVDGQCQVRGRKTPEMLVAEMFDVQGAVLGVGDSPAKLAQELDKVLKELKVDLFIGMDVGSDSFFSGDEVKMPRTPLIDFISLGVMTKLSIPTFYGLAGYGCDGELELDDLERNVGKVMRAGGFLGAYGLSQRDAADIIKICAQFPDPVEKWPAVAARGELGAHRMLLTEPWGTTVRLSPLTAVDLFFDPQVLVEEVATAVKKIRDTDSLKEAEEVLLQMNVLPETRLVDVVEYLQ
ncbi:MAG: DUF1152 domain-containing protein [Firmicutes bacterium]|nr:DUF1152 domain-containing protein [Bacillota bacterium]